MKCQSVACIWSGAPPLHRITATAVLNEPPTLYTGGSDGSIIWWNLSTNKSNQEIRPMAMLCGHATAIADLDICFPVVAVGHGEIKKSGNVLVNSISASYGALISACTDGVLCIWSRGSGHCRRRRKMPPWVGSPSMVRTLPASPRYVCIACNCVDAVNALNHQSMDPSEGAEASVERESQYRRTSKCAIVIVDSYTLNIIQTVFHGNLSIGPLKFMAVVPSIEEREKQSVIMVDALGKLQLVPISKESDPDREGGPGLQKSSSHTEMSIWTDGLSEGGNVMSFATCGQLLALIYRTHCIFRLVVNGTVIGEISLVDTPLCDEGTSTQLHLIGGMFIKIDDGGNALNTWDSSEGFAENFAVWNNRGAAILYTVSGSDSTFKFESLCEIPAVSHPLDVRISVCFIQLNRNLLRIESICFHVEESMLWKPHVTIWLLCQSHDDHGKLGQQCKMLGKGGLFVDWIISSSSVSKDIGNNAGITPTKGETEAISWQNCIPSSKDVNGFSGDIGNNGLVQKDWIVSSSMVLYENFYAPYAVVYGLYSGEIEVVRFEMHFQELNSHDGSPLNAVDQRVPGQSFSGHTGAILCLAAHHMVGTSNGLSFSRVLVSGSMDCTIRIWDLDASNIITVLHHHIAPVRQIILPPPWTDRPWSDCFLSVGEDCCVALSSLETLRVERMFPGHPNYPTKVVWDSARGYIACLCRNHSGTSDAFDVLYLWDVKTGARERVLRGTASHSMFDHFCKGININSITDSILGGNTSASSLLHPIMEDATSFTQSHYKNFEKGATSSHMVQRKITNSTDLNVSLAHASKGNSAKLFPSPLVIRNNKHPIKCSCPFPGIASLRFDLSSLISPCQDHTEVIENGGKQENARVTEQGFETPSSHNTAKNDSSDVQGTSSATIDEHEWVRSLEGCLLRFSLSFLHLWDIDRELDRLLTAEMKLSKPENFIIASGLQGDRGSLTLTFPGLHATLELWRSSSEFCAMRSLTMVSLAQRMISLSHSSSAASSALAAFYTRNFAEKVPDIKPPLLQVAYSANDNESSMTISLLVSFWQDESEHVRMAARTLFHCAASRAIPLPLCAEKANEHAQLPNFTNGEEEFANSNSDADETCTSSFLDSDRITETQGGSQVEESTILLWLESFEMQDWISCVGGTSQDAMASHIIVAAALAIWYPSLVKLSLATLVVHPLMKLVMAMSEKYSSTAAELLAEGMESTWKACISPEIPRLIGDIFFQIECVSGASADSVTQNAAVSVTIRETLVGTLLPSLAMADVPGFLTVIERQIWATSSDSPVHLVSLMTLIRVVRGSPKPLAQHLDKCCINSSDIWTDLQAVNFILQTMDHGNSVMRKACLQSSMTALKEVARIFPMVTLNEASTRLAVGDPIGDINSVSILVYDMQSVTKIKVLDASGPPGLPSLLAGSSKMMVTTAISALSFSPDGEGLVAFSEHGLMIRWWSLGSAWWEKLSRNFVPVQCTKLIFVPPWEEFSPNSFRSSIMASIMGHDRQAKFQDAKSKTHPKPVFQMVASVLSSVAAGNHARQELHLLQKRA
ncbi:hypothetical protein HHK36_027646 [Tetracentron sinense]|uniref:Transducin/WD40 repeat-like superfamily protein n=1 Tax=Tetracentron sinense TaxID=13715 RepID=A0A834YEC5_TETSI|nr:hypothetical protein HHK36_027646 [Tetracentron sinense]